MLRDSLAASSQPDAGIAAVGPATELPAEVPSMIYRAV
jgi:hypothetical protein